ncbi:molybdopterin molybdotransferase [Andreprevotia lacus DSM 23236]|jgi:molybdopterin molybdotransferase|uniref:Molybdopterin molybdenumtransferase n=1 Tax=Andreprevotia lacus DSM 23236 TaxID=1121001 RepID=A0A1W1XWX9_9NEIS|nr:gephyrin-like molybdotransferase Glp [Andreprevotia lacus]SMC28436.1 molybdopterin molybdotransferase [Andreprevotia lacus DSM 23236]
MLELQAMRDKLARIALPAPASECVALSAAVGRICAQTLRATVDLPGFDNSAMDGYAVAVDAARPLGQYEIIGYAAAGSSATGALRAGQALRVLTGAPLPFGCQSVVPQEQVRVDGKLLQLAEAPVYGAHMRVRGSELAAGTRLLEQGTTLRPLHIGLLAAQGIAELDVHLRPRVGVLSTGSELVPAGQPLTAGRIHDANRPQLLALLTACGADAIDLGQVPDDPEATRERLADAAACCDIVISSGGASVGDADHVRHAASMLGGIDHWKVAIKPGKPFAFGHLCGKPFLALPGNPVAAAVTFLLLARPLVRRAAGGTPSADTMQLLPLTEAVHNRDMRPHFMRARRVYDNGMLLVQPFAQQGSAALATLAEADVLIEVPPQTTLSAGSPAPCHLLSELIAP